MGYGLYLHIPFCRQKCFYCDFPSSAGHKELMKPYVAALIKDLQGRYSSETDILSKENICTVYIGGGTPTALDAELLEQLLFSLQGILHKHADSRGIEFTVEMNPGTADVEKLHLLKKYGVNRLSIGVQSFADDCLKKIGRIHTGQEAVDAVRMAKEAGFANISIDLIYGLPGQTLDDFQKNVAQALDLNIQHISIYGLQVEEGTVFGKMAEQGRLQLPSEEESEAMYDYLNTALPAAGFNRYEISNYAKAGYESRHNLSYWQDIPYIGLGAGAHAYWQGKRYENPIAIKEYISQVERNENTWQIEEELTEKEHIEEFCFLALRTAKGISREKFRKTFSTELEEIYKEVISKLCQQGLLVSDEDGVRLTYLGMKYGNQVFQEFLLQN